MRGSSQRACRPSSTENSTTIASGTDGDIAAHAGARLVRRRPAGAARWIRDARVIDAGEQGDKRLFDARQIAQGEIAVVELTFLEALADDAFDQVLDGFARVVARCARCRLSA